MNFEIYSSLNAKRSQKATSFLPSGENVYARESHGGVVGLYICAMCCCCAVFCRVAAGLESA